MTERPHTIEDAPELTIGAGSLGLELTSTADNIARRSVADSSGRFGAGAE